MSLFLIHVYFKARYTDTIQRCDFCTRTTIPLESVCHPYLFGSAFNSLATSTEEIPSAECSFILFKES